MGTEVAISFSTLRAQLENEKSSLCKIDENIKKIVQISGRFHNDRFNPIGDYTRGGPRQGRNPYTDAAGKNDDALGKRKHETKTVFSRLSARTQDSEGEEESVGGGLGGKRARVVSAVSRELPTRAAVLRAQGGDEQARTRNRRIFGSLLGTLQKFKQEEIVLQTKVEKKAQVERKIEEQARLEKEMEHRKRKSLFADREHKKATIKALEAKMARVQEFEKWEAAQSCLAGFVLTRAKPRVYWLPKIMNDKAAEKLAASQKFHEKCMAKKRQELQEELQRIEQRCLWTRGPAAKENDPNDNKSDHKPEKDLKEHDTEIKEDDKGRKRDKFAMDVDEKEESDGEDRHDEPKADEVNHDEVKADEANHDEVKADEANHDEVKADGTNHDDAKDNKETYEGEMDTIVKPIDTNEELNIVETEAATLDPQDNEAPPSVSLETNDKNEDAAPNESIENQFKDETNNAETSEHS